MIFTELGSDCVAFAKATKPYGNGANRLAISQPLPHFLYFLWSKTPHHNLLTIHEKVLNSSWCCND